MAYQSHDSLLILKLDYEMTLMEPQFSFKYEQYDLLPGCINRTKRRAMTQFGCEII